ncbi:MAG TPA: ATP-binding cassette domain-containing protein [Candidatus Limnocylindrales bacterium]|nr:ATP-binding cassette domain-containing protein [Candidatus Limnocylindrales bacterium]
MLHLEGVAVRRAGRTILGPLDWTVGAGERWAVVGPNGSGKTTLLQVASTYLWPSSGTVAVLGERIGRIDARVLREVIGYAGSGLERSIDGDLAALDVVMTARHAALAPWWHRYTDADRARARGLLDRLGVGAFAGRTFGSLSTGERQRVQIARALMPEPRLLLLDEPGAGLDLGARETLVDDLAALAADASLAAIVLVSHHVEEIPPGFGHALVLGRGLAVAAGPIDVALGSGPLSEAFGRPLVVERSDGRFAARGLR